MKKSAGSKRMRLDRNEEHLLTVLLLVESVDMEKSPLVALVA
jgi:hypothetical protein